MLTFAEGRNKVDRDVVTFTDEVRREVDKLYREFAFTLGLLTADLATSEEV
jgi:hypothetical protein